MEENNFIHEENRSFKLEDSAKIQQEYQELVKKNRRYLKILIYLLLLIAISASIFVVSYYVIFLEFNKSGKNNRKRNYLNKNVPKVKSSLISKIFNVKQQIIVNKNIPSNKIKNNKTLNMNNELLIHVVCHSHMDPGWIYTLDKYYKEYVKNILDNMIYSLSNNKERKFILAEVVYFKKWYDLQEDETKKE